MNISIWKARIFDSRFSLLAGALSCIGSLPAFPWNGIPGYDASSHVAKAAFLMYSFSHGNLSGWSGFWYSGFQLFYTYSPLTYVLAAAFGWPFNSALLGMKILIVLSFFLSGAGAFLLAEDFQISTRWSLVAALLYSITSPHILTLFYTGSLAYSLAFALAPFLFLSLRIAIRRQSLGSVVSFGFMIALMVISNESTSYVILFPLAIYLILSTKVTNASKTILIVIGALLIGFLLSAFWLIPFLKIDLSGQLNLLTQSAVYSPQNVVSFSSLFLPDPSSTNEGDLGWLLLLPALLSIVFLKKREEFALFGAAVVTILLTVGASISPLFYKIPLVLALQFPWRFVIGDVLLLASLSALFFSRLVAHIPKLDALKPKEREILALCSVCLIFLIISVSIIAVSYGGYQPRQSPSDPNQSGAYKFLSDQNSNFYRVMVFDRYNEAFPEYTLKGSIQGWYDQGTTQTYRNFTSNIYYCGPNNRTLSGLQLLGVNYVMIDYAYGGDATSALKAYDSPSSVFGTPVYNNSEVSIFQVPNSKLIYVSGSFPNGDFSLSQNVNCFGPIPGVPNEDNVNYSISNFTWKESRISFDVVANQSAYVLVSSQYSPGWLATDNESSDAIMVSSPGLPVIHISKGLSHIVLYYSGPPDAFASALSSLIAFGGILFISFALKKKNLKKTSP